MKLKLVGNTTQDAVYLCEDPKIGFSNKSKKLYERRGGIANVSSRLTIEHGKHTTLLNHAVIILDGKGGKTSFVEWRKGEIINPTYQPTLWAHISYLDKVDVDPRDLKADIISADMCTPPRMDDPRLEHIDFLILGADEYPTFMPLVKQAMIVRFKDRIEICRRGEYPKHYPNIWLSYADPLGAGDAFVAELLNLCVASGGYWSDESMLMEKCVLATHQYLREQNA